MHADIDTKQIRPNPVAKLLSQPYPAVVNGLAAPTGGLLRVLTGHTAK